MRFSEFQGQEKGAGESSILLELAAADDLISFRTVVEEESLNIDGFGLWYGRRVGLKKIGLEERTPLMVASMFGSERVLMYMLETGNIDINRACGSDAATALHCAVVGGSANVVEVVKLLLDASADANRIDGEGNRPSDLIIPFARSLCNSKRKMLDLLLNGCPGFDQDFNLRNKSAKDIKDPQVEDVLSPHATRGCAEGKDYHVGLSLLDIKDGMYVSDEFRMYTFKIKPCLRAYTHDWTECPFAHPGENARRRDPRTFHYSCVPCLEFRKGTCRKGDTCEYAHGIFECWLHPAQYRTRLCKDEIGCNRKVCFFAHKSEELRSLYRSTGSGVSSPGLFSATSSKDFSTMSPFTLGSPSVMIPPSSTPVIPSKQSTPMAGSMWSNQSNFAPQSQGLSASRLRTTLSAQDMNLKAELLNKESHRRHQQLSDELCGLSSLSARNNPFLSSSAYAASQGYNTRNPNRFLGLKPNNLENVFGSHDPTIVFGLQKQSLDARTTQLQSLTGSPVHHSMNQQLCTNYPSSLSSSPARTSQAIRVDLAPTAALVSLTTKSSPSFPKRSHGFIDGNTLTPHSGISSTSADMMPSVMSNWGSPNGKRSA